MESFLIFIVDNWIASSILAVLFTLVMLNEGARGGEKISIQQTTNMINKEDAIIVDVRPSDEFKTGHLPKAINIPVKDFNNRCKELKKYQQTPVILVCKTGQNAGSAGQILTKEGFEQIYRLKGGIYEWQAAKLPLVK